MAKSIGYLKLSTWVIVGKDQHGREQGKRVSLFNRCIDFDEVEKTIANFVAQNPNYSRLHVEAEFIIRDFITVCF